MTILRTIGTFPDEVTEGKCTDCRRPITQTGCGPEVGHDDDCLWTMHDGDDRREPPRELARAIGGSEA